MSSLLKEYKKHSLSVPDFHFVLGSGISFSLDSIIKKMSGQWEDKFSLPFQSVENLKIPTAESHKGVFRYVVHRDTKKSICFQCGRLHGYEGLNPKEVVQPVKEAFLAGTKKFILTNISGGLKKEFSVGTIISMRDHINFTGKNPLVGPNPKNQNGEFLGLRFPDMTEVYDQKLRVKITKEILSQGLNVEEGVYIGVLGPSLETPAEINLFAHWEASAVGMSTVWEAIALKHMGAQLAGFSMISNLGSGLQEGKELSNKDMLTSVKSYGEKMLKGFFNFCEGEFKNE